jgi:hypothetical protein
MTPPRIAEKEWAYLRVVYLERNEQDKLRVKSWHTEDKELLKRLQTAFPKDRKYSLNSKPSGNHENRVDIKLCDGQWWSLSYFSLYGGGAGIGVDDPLNAMRTYRLHDDDLVFFYTTLRDEIKCVSGKTFDVWEKKLRSHKEADELGNNSAARYSDWAWR